MKEHDHGLVQSLFLLLKGEWGSEDRYHYKGLGFRV